MLAHNVQTKFYMLQDDIGWKPRCSCTEHVLVSASGKGVHGVRQLNARPSNLKVGNSITILTYSGAI